MSQTDSNPPAPHSAVPPTQPGLHSRVATSDDDDHVKLLSIFYYVLGGLSLIGACGGAAYIVLGVVMTSGGLPSTQSSPPPGLVGPVMIALGIFALLISVTFSAALIYTGRCLQQRRYRILCTVVAGFTCLSIPLGTALGIFTFIVLSRENVRRMFDTNTASPSIT